MNVMKGVCIGERRRLFVTLQWLREQNGVDVLGFRWRAGGGFDMGVEGESKAVIKLPLARCEP